MKVQLGQNKIKTKIKIKDFDGLEPRSLSKDDKEFVKSELRATLSYPYLTLPHHRNDQAVNLSILLYVLGADPLIWCHGFFKKYSDIFDEDNVNYFLEHIKRIQPYLRRWGAPGTEYLALKYMIGY